MTNLLTLFDAHDSEEKAVAAFYRLTASWEKLKTAGPTILCVDRSADVLAYLRELLRRAGYHAYTTNNLHDCLMLMRVTPPGLLLVGPEMSASGETQQEFHLASAKFPVIELGSEFCTRDAGEAAAGLLQKIAACLNPASATPA